MIKFTNLNKYFNKGKKNEIHVVNNASLELPDHGIVTFFGHSGSGKTTLLNVIGGLDSFKGEIHYDDKVINNYKMGEIDKWRSKNVGYVFQNYDLLQNESVYENLAIALSIIGINDKDEVKSRIEYALKAVGLFKYRKKKAYALSGGQMQRVAIARALVKKCTILIADEPTGNLDSANTIEVMNILKSISKNTLVLLVTHEKNIADFYSDQIIEMADGKITSIEENHSKEATLQEEHSNAVYLGDMDKVEQDGESISLTIYKEPGDESKKHIDVFIKNNTLYIRGDSTLKIASENTLKIIDGKRKVINSKELEENSYDNSFYDDTKKGRRGFRSFLINFLTSWQSIFSVKKKTKILYFSMFLIGIVFASSSASYVNNVLADDSSFSYSPGYYGLLDATYNEANIIEKAYEEGYIDSAISKSYASLSYREKITFAEKLSSNVYTYVMPYEKDKIPLLKGREILSNDEIIISQNIADKILADFTVDKTMDYLLDKTLINSYSVSNDEYKIVGISKGDNNRVYYSEEQFTIMDDYPGFMDLTYLQADIEAGHYNVVKGRDVNQASSEKECLIVKSIINQGYTYSIGSEMYDLDTLNLKYDGTEMIGDYKIVGAFEFKTDIRFADLAIISNQVEQRYLQEIDYVDVTSYYSPLYAYIVEGREPLKANEIVVDAYALNPIGSTIKGYTIVGRVSGGGRIQDNPTMMNVNISNIESDGGNCAFTTSKPNEAKEYFKKNGLTFDTEYNVQYQKKMIQQTNEKSVFYSVFVISFVIASVFIFFIMRSRMLADIYTIGVYRSLGASRLSIVSKYLQESAILTLMFTITGYIVGLAVYIGFSVLINTLINITVSMISIPIFVLIGLIIFAASTFVGTLPIVLLFFKTPAQIKSKYDI